MVTWELDFDNKVLFATNNGCEVSSSLISMYSFKFLWTLFLDGSITRKTSIGRVAWRQLSSAGEGQAYNWVAFGFLHHTLVGGELHFPCFCFTHLMSQGMFKPIVSSCWFVFYIGLCFKCVNSFSIARTVSRLHFYILIGIPLVILFLIQHLRVVQVVCHFLVQVVFFGELYPAESRKLVERLINYVIYKVISERVLWSSM